MGMGGKRHAPAVLPSGKAQYPLYRGLREPQGRSGRVRKISPSPEFDPRIVQPVARNYTDWAISRTMEGTKINQQQYRNNNTEFNLYT